MGCVCVGKIENVMQSQTVLQEVCVPGWSSWGRRPISWRLSEATPAPRPLSSRPHASPTLWLSPAASGLAYFYPSSFPAGWGSITRGLCWCETPTQMIHSRHRGRERWRWRNAHVVFMEDSASCGGGGKVAAVRWPSRVQAGLIAGLLNGSSCRLQTLSARRHDASTAPPPPSDSSALHFLPTENQSWFTSETEPTLGSPPGVLRIMQKLVIWRDGGVLNMNIFCPWAIIILKSCTIKLRVL